MATHRHVCMTKNDNIRLSFGRGLTMVRGPMFLMLSKHPRKQNRTKTKRFRAKLAAKNRARRDRIYVRAK